MPFQIENNAIAEKLRVRASQSNKLGCDTELRVALLVS